MHMGLANPLPILPPFQAQSAIASLGSFNRCATPVPAGRLRAFRHSTSWICPRLPRWGGIQLESEGGCMESRVTLSLLHLPLNLSRLWRLAQSRRDGRDTKGPLICLGLIVPYGPNPPGLVSGEPVKRSPGVSLWLRARLMGSIGPWPTHTHFPLGFSKLSLPLRDP
ncbi:uncharacterized protein LY79DRAFT_549138 [Colletotrichum navitas]|uniref:Uncharacterized protein n=1 Tax=Colletotrichum navitas TaxID=681940 RepID=A0AAD8V6A0_9PEZI|nr:uncharacterized protein LY79DRAFT_549138 [Colletotrichum navitas]KAK1594589.1 hypothetical protein LY79DRAFT_549138 [Colletotrichum navitas]